MGEIERMVASANDGTVDEEFLGYLYKGGELLSAGNIEQAREVLEKAFKLQPKNAKAQNLLGLTYFKLGAFDRAAEIYELLVRDNPVDPTLRVNLGLVYLKQNALQRATREFETAVDLAPDHKKAQNYLGLAYAQAGEYARAKDCFVAAGSLTMAEKMEQALRDPSKAPRPISDSRPPAKREAQEDIDVDIDVEPAAAESAEGASGWGRETAPVPAESPPPPAAAPGVLLPLPELARSSALPAAAATFEVWPDALAVRVRGEVLSRLEGLVAMSGSVRCTPEMKRFRGKATDKAFGDGERRMVRASGEGVLYFAPRGRVFVPFELAEESAYFREDAVFAFEETLVFENGRVPSKVAPDLHLVHLRGKGRVLLSVPTPLRSMAVSTGAPVLVPLSVMVGWHGPLTPRVVGIPDEADGPVILPAVELTGEGNVLLHAFRPPQGQV
jgi:tetratricopeptide (TPR) repeat protein